MPERPLKIMKQSLWDLKLLRTTCTNHSIQYYEAIPMGFETKHQRCPGTKNSEL